MCRSAASTRSLRPRGLPVTAPAAAHHRRESTREVVSPSEYDPWMPPRLSLELRGSSLSFSSPSAHPARRSHVPSAGLSTARLRSASRVSHPPDGLLLPAPCRLVSSGSRSWGFALQSLAPRAQPRRLSTPVAVLSFTRPDHRPLPRSIRANAPMVRATLLRADPVPAPKPGPPSRPCSTPESVTPPSGCSPRGGHVALLGFAPLQGNAPYTSAPASGRLLPRACAAPPGPPPKPRTL
jgi:hypothetical protein